MKHLVALFFLIVSVIECSSLLNGQRSEGICDWVDSIPDIIEGKEFLYYTTGHHGHIWSLAVPEENHYIIVSGNTRTNVCRIDTLSKNESTLKWGLDTMALYSHKIKPVARSSYWPFYEQLTLFSSHGEIIFDCTNTNTYICTDSVTFNKKLKELKYLMYWLATPIEIQLKLPTPL